jgi:hypothetical protein
MMDPFNRAEQYRARAEELRTIAEHMSARDAKASLNPIADGLDHHARNLETTGVKFRWGHRRVELAAAD